ncbi:thymidylate synthase [Actinomadura geliboluensis]|uniref:Thymidylate synthase n=1 Tax=Actinomadura geliboluensis TaxID=882440 RepID=A0A5S4H679_9ACTN|nr:thymidylate synthase [Actinomadura geliboluensis]TMR40254.1 hypothetical protein ETD96_11790 [Actinomadura geliboluensis]
MSLLCIQETNLSQAWVQAVRALDALPGQARAVHTVVSISDPTVEDLAVRAMLDDLLERIPDYSVTTVANTIFPYAIAATSSSHRQLVDRYVNCLPRLKQFDGNQYGTYFSRLVHYPAKNGPIDQLGRILERLPKAGRARYTRYEASIDDPAQPAFDPPAEETSLAAGASIYLPGSDNTPGTFPCMSHCSFQLDASGRLHLLATYRSQDMVRKAYGNYLGLARLLCYMASQSGLLPGRLTVVAGQAKIEEFRNNVSLMLSQPMIPGLGP